jgi:MoaA/NifB/PqqE/SkfB family radical SAM enzyme
MGSVPPSLRRANFINTNRCNLRCVYCPQGTHPEDYYADLSPELFEETFKFVMDHGLEEVALGYYGELTMIDEWWIPVRRFLDAGVKVSTTTNGSTPLSPVEVATMARFKYIEFSIDTHDIAILKKVRKKVDARTIVHNFHLVRAYCLAHDLPVPDLAWISVLTIHTVDSLPEFVAFAASNGVKVLHMTEVTMFDVAEGQGLHIVDQDDEVFERAARKVERAEELAKKLGVTMYIREWPRIRARREAIAKKEKFVPVLQRSFTPVADMQQHVEGGPLPANFTRKCHFPFEEFYMDPKGQVYACCVRGTVMGVAKTKEDLETILGGDKYERLREGLRTGVDLDPACVNCVLMPAVPVEAPEAVAEPIVVAPEPEPLPATFWEKLRKASRSLTRV